MFRTILVFTCFLTSVTIYANDGDYEIIGDSLHPISNSIIELRNEKLEITKQKGNYKVCAKLELFNPTQEIKQETIGFELGHESFFRDPNNVSFNDYTIVVNNESKKFKYKYDETRRMHILLYTIQFKPGVNIIEHTYFLKGGSGSLTGRMEYILQTGSRWAGGIIGSIEILINCVGQVNFKNDSYYDFEIVGKGKKEGQEYSIQDGYLYMQMKNTILSRDIIFDNVPMYYRDFANGPTNAMRFEINGDIEHNDFSGFLYYYEYVLKNKLDSQKDSFEKQIKLLSKDKLKIVRNTIFAMKGYIFRDKELNALFSNFLWYFPDPNIKADSSSLNSDQIAILNSIIEEESKK